MAAVYRADDRRDFRQLAHDPFTVVDGDQCYRRQIAQIALFSIPTARNPIMALAMHSA
jgi:hypothetical protein